MIMPQFDQAHFRRALTLAVIVPPILMLIVIGALLAQIRYLVWTAQQVEGTESLISQVHETQRLLVDMETGLRGYLVTGSTDFLEPYTQTTALMGAEFDDIARL